MGGVPKSECQLAIAYPAEDSACDSVDSVLLITSTDYAQKTQTKVDEFKYVSILGSRNVGAEGRK